MTIRIPAPESPDGHPVHAVAGSCDEYAACVARGGRISWRGWLSQTPIAETSRIPGTQGADDAVPRLRQLLYGETEPGIVDIRGEFPRVLFWEKQEMLPLFSVSSLMGKIEKHIEEKIPLRYGRGYTIKQAGQASF